MTVPTLVIYLCQLTLYPSVHWLALWLTTLELLAIAALAGFCNPLPYGMAAHTYSKHLSSISMALSAASYSCCMFASSISSILLHKLSASMEWTGQVSLYCIASSSSSCLYEDVAAPDTPPTPPYGFLLPCLSCFVSYPLATSFVSSLLYLLGVLPLAAWLYLPA